ncbi:MAG TPA: hypothetical protein VNJ09_08325 [Chthonomonadales bacterium]|nr:hypothetical protein [Chthonomonadales bacterium]
MAVLTVPDGGTGLTCWPILVEVERPSFDDILIIGELWAGL